MCSIHTSPWRCELLKAGTASVTSVTLSGAESTGVSLNIPKKPLLPLLVLPWPLGKSQGSSCPPPRLPQRCS